MIGIIRYLRDFRRRHFEAKRVAKCIAVSIPTILIGNWLLHYEVSNLGLEPRWAFRANWPIITFLCFILNRAFTWSDRDDPSIMKWVLISLLHSSVSQLAYPQLVAAGIHYMLASALLLGLSPIYFVLNNLHSFGRRNDEDGLID